MILEEILGNEFVAVKNVQQVARESGVGKAELKRQKHLLGVKTIQIESEYGVKVWLWYLPHKVFYRFEFWAV